MWKTLEALSVSIMNLPSKAAILCVLAYQWVLSPALNAIFGPGTGCRFYPTCSQYAVQSLREHGLIRGLWLTLRRILRCHPYHPGGHDPVPPACCDGRPAGRRFSADH